MFDTVLRDSSAELRTIKFFVETESVTFYRFSKADQRKHISTKQLREKIAKER
jgi:hypothetical protein